MKCTAAVTAIGLVILACCITGSSAHAAGDYSSSNARIRQAYTTSTAHALESCNQDAKFQNLLEQSLARRYERAQSLRKRNSFHANSILNLRSLEDLERYGKISHHSDLTGVGPDIRPEKLFGANVSCVVSPEVTEGPYYINNEYIRRNITDGQKGVALVVELQIVNVKTCKPAEGFAVDLWSANAMGIYSGVLGNEENFLRGVQFTDDFGVASFDTIFPGDYADRSTHLHIMVHSNVTKTNATTYISGPVPHVGQLFFDEELRSQIRSLPPYDSNSASHTSNREDQFAQKEASEKYDPFVNYVLLGEDVSDGIMAWISIGIDPEADYSEDLRIAGTLKDVTDSDSSIPRLNSGTDTSNNDGVQVAGLSVWEVVLAAGSTVFFQGA